MGSNMHDEERKYAAMPTAERQAQTQTSNGADKPFARHDARNSVAPAVRSDTSLRSLIDRLGLMADRHGNSLHAVAGLLEDHADRMHGMAPPNDKVPAPTESPYYGDGLLAQVWVMVDNLDQVLDYAGARVATQAGRNANVA